MLYKNMSIDDLKKELALAKSDYDALQKEGLKLDISRGKPCKEQLDLSDGLLSAIDSLPLSGADLRNYGGIEGIPELRDIFADILGVRRDNVLIGNNSSLQMMYDAVQRAMQFGIMGSAPWNKLEKVRFLCPVPGYDRHFAITELFGIEMIAVPMDDNGPDMDIVESYVANDPSVKGMWCVPKYSNPTGITYSDSVVERLAKMECISPDFRIFWDNAYAVHDLYEDSTDTLKNLYAEAEANGNADRVYMFTSFSKITYAGASVACFATSPNNIRDSLKYISMQTICPNKIVQYAHFKFLPNKEALKAHMAKHAEILRPKFQAVEKALSEALGESDIATWSKPNGGYFINYDVLSGCAKKIGELCKDAGLTITTVGATYPYGIDDNDGNIRIAPTFTSGEELETAIKILISATKIACFTKIIEIKESQATQNN